MTRLSRKQGQIDRTKHWICEALLQLAKGGEFEATTISRICEKAGVGRPTFYRHFNSKEDVIFCRLAAVFDQLVATLDETYDGNPSVGQVNLETLRAWKRNKALFGLARYPEIASILAASLDQYFETIVTRYSFYGHMSLYRRHFRIGGMKEVLVAWARDGMEETPEDMHRQIMEPDIG